MRKGRKEEKEKSSETTKRRKQGKENVEISKGIEIANKAVEKEKNKRAKNLQKQAQEDKKKSPIIKYILWLVLAGILLLLAKYRHIIGITIFKEITEEDAILIETTTSDNKVYAYQNEILVYSKGSLATYSKYGKKTWEYTFEETFIPEITTNGKYIQVVNKDSGYIYVFDNKYESTRKKIEGTIKKASINEKGQSIVHYSKEGIKSNVGIFDKKGNEKYAITLSTENVARVELTPNGRYAVIYEVETKGISPNSLIKIVDLEKDSEVTTSLDIANDIVYDLKVTNSKIILVSSSNVYRYDIKTNSKKELSIDDKNISSISVDSSGIAYVCKELSEENNTVVMQNNRYEEIGKHKFEENVKYFTYYNSLAYVTYNKEINIYNRWGMHIKRFVSSSIITTPIIFNNGKNIAISYSNRIVIIGI